MDKLQYLINLDGLHTFKDQILKISAAFELSGNAKKTGDNCPFQMILNIRNLLKQTLLEHKN